MKRASEPPANSREKVFRRQAPVSCQFCRSRKLRCNRAIPCSNCIARNITCSSALGGSARAVSDSTQPGHDTNSQSTTLNCVAEHTDLKARLERLERIVLSTTGQNQQNQASSTIVEPQLLQVQNGHQADRFEGLEDDGEISKTAEWIENAAGTPRYYADLAMNEFTTNMCESLLLRIPAIQRTKPLSVAEICCILPSQPEARRLLTFYMENINWVYHIIHVPTIWRYTDILYERLMALEMPEMSHLALIATLLALVALFWPESTTFALTGEDARSYYVKLRILAERTLSEARHLESPTIETIQATVLLWQFMPNFGDVANRSVVLGLLVHSSHILQLHQVDSSRNQKLRAEHGCDMVELEMKRRVWWNIVGTDWLLAYMSGFQKGTYITNPDQMKVLGQSNVDDEDISSDGNYEQPFLGLPTEMTYSIVRNRFARIIRELVDTANRAGIGVDELDYDQVLCFDEKLNNFLNEVPYYFRNDTASRKQSQQVEEQRPYIAWQRIWFLFGFHTRISRLHRPYVSRGYQDPRYAYSRMICLRSARIVLELEESISKTPCGHMWLVSHNLFVATITLVMDYCCHRDDPQAEERKQEILRCYKVLEKSGEDPVARHGLAHLNQIMNNWRIKSETTRAVSANKSPEPEAVLYRTPDAAYPSETLAPWRTSNIAPGPIPGTETAADIALDTTLDFWFQDSDFDLGFDFQWEALFRDLENQQSSSTF